MAELKLTNDLSDETDFQKIRKLIIAYIVYYQKNEKIWEDILNYTATFLNTVQDRSIPPSRHVRTKHFDQIGIP